MINYYDKLYTALDRMDVERRTFNDGREAIFSDGRLIAANTEESISWDDAEIKATIKQSPELVIFGAGYVSKAIYDIAIKLGMKVTVVDEREEICSAERFPEATRFTGKPYPQLLKMEYTDKRPYFVIMTHGHSYDNICLRYALRHKSSYVGMIGSKGKVKATFDDLSKDGFTEEELSSVHAPIGLKIGAVTPEEIAISIMAEIIGVFRSEKSLICLDLDYLKSVRDRNGIILRIVEKKGSAPRATGSEMFITEDESFGSIGGGAVEYEAVRDAREMLKNNEGCKTIDYNLSARGDLKMICGGDIKVLFMPMSC